MTKEEIAMGYVDQNSSDGGDDFKLFFNYLDKHQIPNKEFVIHAGVKLYRGLKKRSDAIRMIRRMKSLQK